MIDNSLLKSFVEKPAHTRWHLKSTAFFTDSASGNTENRIKALNTALNILYSDQEYQQLLSNVGMTVSISPAEPGQLTFTEFQAIQKFNLESINKCHY